MRVLTVHNFYGSEAPSGENAAYIAERDLLAANGVTVAEFTRHSDEIRGSGLRGMLRGGITAAWNPAAARGLRRRVRQFRPDIVHVHNTFPLISPAIFRALRHEAPATVMTVHNFRIACASAMLSRDNRPCTLCVDQRSVWPALKHACYRESVLATVPIAATIALHRQMGTWQTCVDAFIALTDFQAQMLVRSGVPSSRLHVKPNVYPLPAVPLEWSRRSDRVVFIGRIGPEKGLDIALEAWRQWGDAAPRLEVIGEGSALASARRFVESNGLQHKVGFHGALPFAETQDVLKASKLLLVPSRVFEGYPMVIREAFALGVPVAASDIGSLRALVDEGVVGVRLPAGDAAGALAKIRALWSVPDLMQEMSNNAHDRYRVQLAATPNFASLASIYANASDVRQRRFSFPAQTA